MKKYAWTLGQSFVSETTNSYLFETFLNVLYQSKDELNNPARSNGEFWNMTLLKAQTTSDTISDLM